MPPFQTENGNPGDFPESFTVCSSCKRKFAFCLFVYEETNGTDPFKNLLNRLTHFVRSKSSESRTPPCQLLMCFRLGGGGVLSS